MTVKQGDMYIEYKYMYIKNCNKKWSQKTKGFQSYRICQKEKKIQRLPRGFKVYALKQSFLNQDSFLNSSFLNRNLSA